MNSLGLCVWLVRRFHHSSRLNLSITTASAITPPGIAFKAISAAMAWLCSGRTNQELISNLRREGLIHSTRVAEAMAKVDRKAYCPDPRSAYQDSPQTIGCSATISAPHMHAHAAEELLEYLKPDSSVLDVGSGSGYLAALFHHLVKPMPGHEGEVSGAHSGSRVIGIEHIEPLVKQSVENMKTDGLSDAMSKGQIEVVLGDGRKGEARERQERLCPFNC